MESVFEKIINRFKKMKGSDALANMFISDVIKVIQQEEAKYNNGWIPVECGESDTEPKKDCEIWVTRKNCFGDVWVQKCPYYVGDGFWDGVIAWKPLEEQPEPYQPKGEVYDRSSD